MYRSSDGRTSITITGKSTLPYIDHGPSRTNSNIKLYHDLEGQSSNEVTSSSLVRRLGNAAVTTLSITAIIVLAVASFLVFLWHSNADNGLWHTIVAHQWLPRAVTISCFALRSAVDLQIGIATATLAAIVLESGNALLRYGPHLSTARASKPKPRTLLFPVWRSYKSNPSLKQVAISIGLSILCCTAICLQFSSTFLLSDLDLGPIPGLASQSNVSYDFAFPVKEILYKDPSGWDYYSNNMKYYHLQKRVTTWLRNPPAYPTFAEYSEPPPSIHGVDDTGVLLRAFLPFADLDSRQALKQYSGKAFVLDSRVSCQPPRLTNLYSQSMIPNQNGYRKRDYNKKEDFSFEVASVKGSYGPSMPAERLWAPATDPGFHCYVALAKNVTTICQVQGYPTLSSLGVNGHFSIGNRGGGLISEFSNITLEFIEDMLGRDPNIAAYFTWGTAMLAFRALEWDVLRYVGLNYTNSSDGSLRYYKQEPWLNIMQSGHGAGISANISVSLCYAAWDTTKMSVNMHSESNRTEPVAYWNPQRKFHTIPSVINQMGSNRTGSHSIESRGLLNLKKKESWVRTPEDTDPINYMPYVQQYGDMSIVIGPEPGPTLMTGNWTAFLGNPDTANMPYIYHTQEKPAVWVDPNLVSLFDDFMESSGSVARAISSMITVLSGMAYYDQFPGFRAKTNATQLFFSTVLLPQSKQGFWSVMVLVFIHTGLVSAAIGLFYGTTRYTLIGNHWASVSQMWMPQSSQLLLSSSRKRDKDIRKELVASGREQSTIRIVEVDDGGRVGLVETRKALNPD